MAKPDLTALAISPTLSRCTWRFPSTRPSCPTSCRWGLDLVVPDSPDEGFEYWETLSWENAASTRPTC